MDNSWIIHRVLTEWSAQGLVSSAPGVQVAVSPQALSVTRAAITLHRGGTLVAIVDVHATPASAAATPPAEGAACLVTAASGRGLYRLVSGVLALQSAYPVSAGIAAALVALVSGVTTAADQAALAVQAAAANGAAIAAHSDRITAAEGALAEQADALTGLAADQSAEQATRAAADAALLSANAGRPGEGRTASTIATGSFAAALAAPLPEAWSIVDPVLGSAIEITGARVDPGIGYADVCAVDRVAIETGHTYVAEWRLRQTLDPVDPIGDAVRAGITWLTAGKALLATQVVETFDLAITDGVRHIVKTIGRAAGEGINIVAPAGAVYAALWLRRYGTTGTTVLSVLRLRDGGTLTGTMGGDLAAEVARAIAAEAALAARIAELETVAVVDLVVTPEIAEMGLSVTPHLAWMLAGTADVDSLTVNGDAIALDATAWAAPGAITADTTYTVTVTDTLGRASSATAGVDFRARVFWGASAAPALTSTGVVALASSILATARGRSVTIDASGGAYAYYAYPVSMGIPQDVMLYGFSVDFDISIVSVTTEAGYTADYYVIRSTDILDDTSVVIGVA